MKKNRRKENLRPTGAAAVPDASRGGRRPKSLRSIQPQYRALGSEQRPRAPYASQLAHSGAAIARCEERYPQTGPHTILVVVVEREPAQWREALNSLHSDLFGPGKRDPLAPVQPEVIDRATDEAIQRLMVAGLIGKTTRAVRPLFPVSDSTESASLSGEEVAKVKSIRERADRKLKLARVLDDSGFSDEARPALLDAMLGFAGALAVEHHLTEPNELKEALQPPLSNFWANALPALKKFFHDSASDLKPVLECLGSV